MIFGFLFIFEATLKLNPMGAFIVASYFLFPALLLILSTRFHIVNKIGIVVFSYAGGLLIGIANIVPDSLLQIQNYLAGFTIMVGIPLVLFSENIVKWTKMAKTTFISLLLGVASVVILVFVGYFIFKDRIPEIGKGLGGALREFRKVKKELSSSEPDDKSKETSALEDRMAKKVLDKVPGVKKAMDIKEKVKKVKEVIK